MWCLAVFQIPTTAYTVGWELDRGLQWYIHRLVLLMMTSSNVSIFCVTGPLCGEFTGHRWIPHTKASNAELWCFLWSVPWINGWVNNREAGDLRRHRAHYDVTVMKPCKPEDAPVLRRLMMSLSHNELSPWGMCLLYVISLSKIRIRIAKYIAQCIFSDNARVILRIIFETNFL